MTDAQEEGQSELLAEAQDLGSTLFNSSEYAGLATSNAQFVTDLYVGYLQRQPNDPPDGNWDGYNFWLGMLNGSGNRANLIAAFDACGEFQQHVSGVCVPSTGGTGNIHWLVADQLGTPRMIFDQSGTLAKTSRHDYLPFGEELFAGTGGRTTAQGYSASDGVRQHFTLKERDIETGLDYFGARYFASTQGRFASADSLMSSGTVENPQSWNRYSYVLNHPLELTDPFGLYVFHSSVSDPQREEFRKGLSKARSNLWKIAATYGVHSKEFKKAERALNAYGNEGEKNGVSIHAIKESNYPGYTQTAGAGVPKDIRVTFRSDMFDNQGLDQIISHEGSHVADVSDWVVSGYANSKDPTNYQTEFDAYTVQFLEVQADFNNKGKATQWIHGRHQDPGKATWIELYLTEWDEGWKEADRATMRANNINNLLERPKDVHGYELTPAKQGGPAFDKRGRFK